MKKVIVSILIGCLFMQILGGCKTNMVSQEQLIGIWQTSDFNDDLSLDLEIGQGVEVYFTSDFNVYIQFMHDTTAGVLADSFQYKYRITGSTIDLDFVETSTNIKILPKCSMKIENDRITLNVNGAGNFLDENTVAYVLNKKSDVVPYGYTDADKQEIQAKDEKAKQDIRLCAQRFSDSLNMAVIESGERAYIGGGYCEQGINFEIEDIIICITLSSLATPFHDEFYILADAGYCAVSVAIPCVVSGEFALVYDEGAKPPQEWLDAFVGLFQ